MICTEKDAAEKWCPQVRHVPILDEKALSPANRFGPENKPDVDNPTFARCIGSRCMMWEWEDDRVGWHSHRNEPDPNHEWHSSKRRGTCGLINGSGQ